MKRLIKSSIFISIIALASLAVSSLSFANTWYVDNKATGGNNGTSSANAWTSLAKIVYGVGGVTTGDTVLVNAGTYNERVTTGLSGTSTAKITYKANGPVIMKGFTINHDYITVDGFEITGTPAGFTTAHGVHITGKYAEVLNCTIHDTALDGYGVNFAYRGTTSNGLVKGNTIYKCYGMAVYVNGTNHVIDSNDISAMLQGSDDCDCFRAFGSGHIFRNNYIHDFTPQGTAHIDVLQVFGDAGDNCTNILFEKNMVRNFQGQIFHLSSDGMQISNFTFRDNVYDSVTQAAHTYILTYVYNNTFYNCGTDNDWVIYFRKDAVGGDSSGSIAKNNIFSNSGSSQYNGWYTLVNSPSITTDYNMVYPTKVGFQEANGINGANPSFLNPTNHDFHLQLNSPAIDKGLTLGGFAYDKGNATRPQGNGWDIGAYEVGKSLPKLNLRIQ